MKRVEEDQRRYPLYWPEGWPRTRSRNSAPYRVSASRAKDHLLRELTLMKAKRIVVSTNVPYRADGLPYANFRRVDDPGVAVYWTDSKGIERVVACDKWSSVDDNIRAVGLAVEALRAIERTGASEILERAFRGFTALPASTVRSWRDVFGYAVGERPDAESLKARYRKRAFDAHPDRGTDGGAAAINVAYDEARKELGYV